MKALRRWAANRLTLSDHIDGTVEAFFQYEGTTCSDTGHAIRFDYAVSLGPEEEGYPIRGHSCRPAPEDRGHTRMCRFETHGASLLADVNEDAPLQGRPLNDVLTWAQDKLSAGCFCDAASRSHKWGLVLQTLHFAMVHRERNRRILQTDGA